MEDSSSQEAKFFRRRLSDRIPMKDCPEAIKHLLGSMAAALEGSRQENEIVDAALKAACDFFEADWVCALDVDLDLSIWTPNRWYDAVKGPMAETKLGAYQYSDGFIRWVEALRNKRTVSVVSLEDIREKFPEEYAYYGGLNLTSLIAVPYECGVTGFFIVKNPKRNADCADMLLMLTRLIAHELNMERYKKRLEYQTRPFDVEDERDIVIRFFGGLEIAGMAGVIPASEIQNKVIGRIIAVLVTSRGLSASARQLASMIYPEGDPSENAKNISKNISKFRLQYSSFFGEQHLIIKNGSVYQLNSYYNIRTDFQQFDRLRKEARNALTEEQKIASLKGMIRVYEGHVMSDFADDHWLVGMTQEYRQKHHSVVEELCSILMNRKDYDSAHHYAAKALKISPENGSFYLWMYQALIRKGLHAEACDVLQNAHVHLSREEYHELHQNIGSIVSGSPCFA